MKTVPDKFAIAAALQEIGALLELKSGEYFKARAYKRGARAVSELTEEPGKLIKENRLTSVSGIGYAIAKQPIEAACQEKRLRVSGLVGPSLQSSD